MTIEQDVEAKLTEVCEQLGIDGVFTFGGAGTNVNTLLVTVGSWPNDYSIDPAKLLALLDAKTLILMALRLSAP